MILGLHGKMGSGKNEAAKRLAVMASLPVVEVSYAAKLKESAAALLGCTVANLERWKNDPRVGLALIAEEGGTLGHQTVRSFLQRYGTESHRDVFGQDFWLDVALPYGGIADRDLRDPYSLALYVVTDVRFPNEAERIRDLGGTVVRIIGPSDDTGSHPSEQPIVCDREIDNTIRDDGHEALDYALAELLGLIDFDDEARIAMGLKAAA